MFFVNFIYNQNLLVLSIATVITICLWSYLFLHFKNRHLKIINFIFFVISVFAIIFITLVSRESGENAVSLLPFDFIRNSQIQIESHRAFFMNIILFVPVGITMPYLLSEFLQKRRIILITVCFSLVVSCFVEFMQYYYHLGVAETDDVIANVFGALIGCSSFWLYALLNRNAK